MPDLLFVFSFWYHADSPWLEQPEVLLLLQTVINILLPPRIISTSRSKNFMLESSPAHCSTPGDAGKDLRKEGLAESTSQAAYLGEWEFQFGNENWEQADRMTIFPPQNSLFQILNVQVCMGCYHYTVV